MNGEREDKTGRNDASSDEQLLRKAAGFLDAQTAGLDTATRVALTEARVRAAESARTRKIVWGGAGVALAASLTAIAILPQGGNEFAPVPPAASNAMSADVDFNEVALIDDTESAIADEDLAFVAWLEENNDPS